MYEISVVVPTLNSGKTLEWTLLALLKQEDCHVHIMVVDSGSKDATLDICQRFGVPVIYAAPGNMYHAINVGLRTASSEWCTYLNSDDIVYSDAYERLIKLGESQDACVVYGDVDFMDAQMRFLYRKYAPPVSLAQQLLTGAGILPFAQPSAIFRKSLFDRLNGFDERYRNIADYDFFLRASRENARFAYSKGTTVSAFRVHSNQLSHREGSVVKQEKQACYAEAGISRRSIRGIAAHWLWRVQNALSYMARIMLRV